METKIQIRITEDLKDDASYILNKQGLTLSTAIRMFLIKVVASGGLPFTPATNKEYMSLDEINSIIKEVRDERKARK